MDDDYKKALDEAQALYDENQRKIDILLADMSRQELRDTKTDAATLARLERDLVDLVNSSRIKRAKDRVLLRQAAVTLHKVRHKLLDEADVSEMCERCMNPHVLKDQAELDDVCGQCPLNKAAS